MSDNTVTDLADLGALAAGAPVAAAAEEAPAAPPARTGPPAPIREKEIDAQGRSYATGRRKDAVARVWIKPGSGKVTVNGRDQDVYFARPTLRLVINQVFDVLIGKMAKRGVDVRCLDRGKVETISGDKVKQIVTVKAGIDQELGKKIQKMIKDAKLKVQASIQGDAVRVSGAKKDELQQVITLVKKTITDFPVQFGNFRD